MAKVGLIGCGRWGQNHAKSLTKLNCEFVGVADSDENKKPFVESLGVKYYKNYQELIDECEALIVAVPTFLHYDVVKNALTKDKHVLVEKPVTLNSDTTKNLVSLAEKKRLILSVGYIYRFHMVVLQLKKLLRNAGKIHYINARYIGGQNRLWADSGAIINFGIHLIDILNFVLEERPIKVYAKKQNLLDESREDSAIVVLAYSNFHATLELSCVHPEKKREMWVIADKKKIFADFNSQRMTVYNISFDASGIASGSSDPEEITIMASDPLSAELSYFLNCVDNYNIDPYLSIKNIGREEPDTVKVCGLALESAVLGVELPTEIGG